VYRGHIVIPLVPEEQYERIVGELGAAFIVAYKSNNVGIRLPDTRSKYMKKGPDGLVFDREAYFIRLAFDSDEETFTPSIEKVQAILPGIAVITGSNYSKVFDKLFAKGQEL
jgi:hypothetical protein